MTDLENLRIKSVDDAFVVDIISPDVSRVSNRKTMGVVIATSGTLWYHQNGHDFLSDRDHVLFLPIGQSYYIERGANSHCPLINFTLEGKTPTEIISVKTDKTDRLEKLFGNVERLVTFNKNAMQYKIKSLMYEILSEILDDSSNSRLSGKYEVLRPSVEFLEGNISDPTLDNVTLSKCANISEVYFRRLFSEVYGKTPKQYIMDVRLTKACDLLSGGELNVTEVSELCGYKSLYSFSRAFKKKFNVSPEGFKARVTG